MGCMQWHMGINPALDIVTLALESPPLLFPAPYLPELDDDNLI